MKRYPRIRGAAALFLVATFGSTSGLGQQGSALGQGDPRLIIDLPNYGDSSIIDIRLRGSVRGLEYSISASRAGGRIIFDVTLNNRSGRLEIPSRDFPDLDLRTIREGISQVFGSETLSFDVEYGNLGGCFGSIRPKKLLISFNVDGIISASDLGNQNCGLVWRQLNLSQRAPSVYTLANRD